MNVPAVTNQKLWTWLWKPFLIAAAFLALYPNILRPGISWGDDWAMYVAHARNFVTGHPYLDTGFLYSKLTAASSPTSCPPGYPFLLSLVYRVKGLDFEALKMVSWTSTALALFVIGWFFRARLGDRWALVVMLTLGGSVVFLDEMDILQSDTVCVVLVYAFFLVHRWLLDRRWDRQRPLIAAVLVLIPVMLATFTRIASLPMAGALILDDFARRRRPTWFSAAFACGFVTLFLWASRTFPGGLSYADQLHVDLRVQMSNAWAYLKWASYVWIDSFSGLLRYISFAVFTASAGVAFYRRVRQGPTILEFFFVLHMAMLVAYPAGAGLRYMLPVIPLYCAYAIEGILPLTGNRIVAVATTALLLAVPAGNLLYANRSPIRDGPNAPGFQALVTEVRRSTSADDRFLLWKPRAFALFSGRSAGFYVRTDDTRVFWSDVAGRRIQYVIRHKDDPEDQRWLEPKLRQSPERFELKYENPEFALYAVR
jgi:hypothetical protein